MISGIVTGCLLVLFVIGCVWAFSPRQRGAFDEAAQLPLREDETAPEPVRAGAGHDEEGGVR